MIFLAMTLAQDTTFRLWPKSASTSATQVDRVYLALLGLTLFFVVLIGALALGFGVKYRAGTTAFRDNPIRRKLFVEFTWILLPTLMTLAIFVWGAYVYVHAATPPAGARTIYVVGKQWMWKIQHPFGRREINELHLPMGEPIKLVMTSQDVIHSFFVPAFRVKQDVIPDRYTTLWFEATEPGEYRLECAEYCGAGHARMHGRVVVMEPARFQEWLEAVPPPETIGTPESNGGVAAAAERSIDAFGCRQCHQEHGETAAPRLAGLFGRPVALRDGRTVVADESYIRRALLKPNADVPIGFQAPSAMPTYTGQLDEEQMIAIIESIKALPITPQRITTP